MNVLTGASIETNTTEEVITGQKVVFPDGQFYPTLRQLVVGYGGEDKREVPLWIVGTFHHRSLLPALV